MTTGYQEFPVTEPFITSHPKLLSNDKAALTLNAGTAFPAAANTFEGMLCYRTDEKKLYQYVNGAWSVFGIQGNAATATAAIKATQDGNGATISTTYLKLAGGTLSGALQFANKTANLVGDDCYFGDSNMGGGVCIQGINGNTKLVFRKYGGADWGTNTESELACLEWNGSTLNSTKTFTVGGSTVALASNIPTKLGQLTNDTGFVGNYGSYYSFPANIGITPANGSEGGQIDLYPGADGTHTAHLDNTSNLFRVFGTPDLGQYAVMAFNLVTGELTTSQGVAVTDNNLSSALRNLISTWGGTLP